MVCFLLFGVVLFSLVWFRVVHDSRVRGAQGSWRFFPVAHSSGLSFLKFSQDGLGPAGTRNGFLI